MIKAENTASASRTAPSVSAADYSKYHLHRMFTAAAGITPHDYILRRQLTHAARLLLYSEMPVLDIALLCGYESRQSFTSAFREMYKMTPARFRKEGEFYPLLIKFTLRTDLSGRDFTADDIRITRLFLEWFSRQPERFFMQTGAGSNACLELSITTFREGDRADTGYRAELKRLGFEERELLVEFGYPTQRFVLPISRASAGADTETSGSAEDRRDPIEHIECIKQIERRT